jgi:hypothetical protein
MHYEYRTPCYNSEMNDSEKKKAQRRATYLRHREKHLAQMRRWNATHKQERREKAKKYYAEHQEEIRERNRSYHHAHRDEHNAKLKIQNQRTRVTHPWRELLHAAKSRARLKKVTFSLTKEWAESRWTGRCELTGLEFKLGLNGVGPQVWSPSIDRIKPSLGYTPENCRFILLGVNIFKSSGTDEDMIFMAESIVKYSMKSMT